MEVIYILFVLFLVLTFLVVAGHVTWVVIAWLIRWLFDLNEEPPPPPRPGHILDTPSVGRTQPQDDLAAFERQLVQFYIDGKINDEVYEQLIARVRAERAPAPPPPRPAPAPEPVVEKVADKPVVVEVVREQPSQQIPAAAAAAH